MKKYKYYSFLIGHPNCSRPEWILEDTKIPAFCVRDAITLDWWMKRLKMENHPSYRGMPRSKVLEIPDYGMVELSYRQVIEYERLYTPDRGFTIHQYKRIKKHNFHNFCDLFPRQLK